MTSDFAGNPYGSFGKLGPGTRIAGYLIEEQIGAGGMAVVFRARDEVLGRLAAIKVLAPSLAGDEEFRARFLRESRAVAAVDSLHIIPVYTAGEAEGLLYIATRFVPGGDLARLVHRSGGRLAAERAVSLVTQVASALDAAHAAGLVHRDVKPQNILVDTVPERGEHAYLSDFGLSKGTQSSTGLTATGHFMGTPDYCAPEQISAGQVDGRTDQYALACVAFVLLTGTLPFHRPEAVATMFAHLQDPVPSATGLRADLPAAVDDVIVRALAKSPAERYGRCGEFAAALRGALAPARAATVAAVPFAPTPVPEVPTAPQSPAYASTIASGVSGKEQPQAAAADGRGDASRRLRRRTALVGGTVALALAAGGLIYALGSSPTRPSKPVLAATFTVPGGGTVGSVQFSGDGKFVAAENTSTIYVWDAASRTYLKTLSMPYQSVLESIAFSANDSSLMGVTGPALVRGKKLPGSVSYDFYRWDLATGARTMIGSVSGTPGSIAFSGDSSTAFITLSHTDVRVATPGHAGHVLALPGANGAYTVPDQNGGRVIYDNTSQPEDITYILDVNTDKVLARLDIGSYITATSFLSPDGETAVVSPVDSAWDNPGTTIRPWDLWNVAADSNVSPADPRWRQQQIWADPVFSTDSSVVATSRADGKTDLWNVAARKYLLTISDPDNREDGLVEAVGPGGSEVVIAGSVTVKASATTVAGFRQLRLWLTPLG